MQFRHWKLGVKFTVAVGVVFALMAAGNLWSMSVILSLKSDLDDVSRNWMGRIIAISEINRSTADLRMRQLRYVASDSLAVLQEQGAEIITLIDQINNNRDTYEELRRISTRKPADSLYEWGLYDAFDRNWDAYQTDILSVIQSKLVGGALQTVIIGSDPPGDIFDSIRVSLNKLVEINKSYAVKAADAAEARLQAFRVASEILLIGSILMSGVFTIVIVRLITRPIRKLVAAAGQVADGELDVRLDIDSRDEIGNLAASFNVMTRALRDSRDRSVRQSAELQRQHSELQAAHLGLASQKDETDRANRGLADALHKLREAQEELLMKEKTAFLGQLVAGVAHELNNPAGALMSADDVSRRILNRLQAINAQRPEATAEVAPLIKSLENNLEVSRTAAERIRDIVSSLRSFARLDEAEVQQADIHQGIDSSIILLGTEVPNRITMTKNYGDLPRITCRPAQLNQVFYNILRNAVDAIEGQGAIAISTETDGDFALLRFSDSGRGIPADRLQQVFGFTLGQGAGRVRMGSGLIASYSIIQQHRGDIAIESTEGVGTTVRIRLPLGRS